MNAHGYATELEFKLSEGYFLCKASKNVEYEFELEFLLPRSDGQIIEYLSVHGGDPHRVLDSLSGLAEVSEVRLIDTVSARARFEVVTSGELAKTLADTGALVTNIKAQAGQGKVTADLPPHVEVNNAVKGFLAEFPNAELVARRESKISTPTWTRDQVISDLLDGLTDSQFRVLREAHESGYFSVPRRNEGQAIAQRLGISSATFSEQLRRAQEKVFNVLFD